MHRDRSGPVLRLAILAALLAGGAWAYFTFAGDETASLVPEQTEGASTFADAGALPPELTTPAPAPEAAPETQPEPEPAPVEEAPPSGAASEPPPG